MRNTKNYEELLHYTNEQAAFIRTYEIWFNVDLGDLYMTWAEIDDDGVTLEGIIPDEEEDELWQAFLAFDKEGHYQLADYAKQLFFT
jgi:hypothetical protein